MNFEHFMPSEGASSRRLESWQRFQEAERAAKSFVGNWLWVEIIRVDVAGNAIWHDDGRIEVPSTNSDSLFHEVFHSVLHHAPFKRIAEQAACTFYCECLCNAFEYFMEAKLIPGGGSWMRRMESWERCGFQSIIEAKSGDRAWDFKYGLATHTFILASGFDIDRFRKIFLAMNA